MATIATWLRTFGVDPKVTLRAARGVGRYISARRTLEKSKQSEFPWTASFPILTEWEESSGNVGAYFFQDRLVARWIYEANPEKHYDVGSRLDGFIGSLSVFREVDAIDIRAQPVSIPNVRFHQIDLMKDLPQEWLGKTQSLSCLHTIEHFGLGRYGDELDLQGHLRGLEQLKKMVAPGGLLYLSTPIGSQRIEFNAHRIFAASTLLDWFTEGWKIEKFAVIDDSCRVLENLNLQDERIETHFGCEHGVGIIAARKLQDEATST